MIIPWNKGHRKYKPKTCPFCNKEFYLPDQRQRFCTRKCFLDSGESKIYGKKNKGNPSPMKGQTKFTKPYLMNASIKWLKNNPMFNPIIKEKALRNSRISRKVKPNRLEKEFIKFFVEFRNNVYICYTGNGVFWVTSNGKHLNPDFLIKEHKKVIEVLGSYWHNEKEVSERIMLYNNIGWNCLAVWDYELKNKNSLRKRINEFIQN